MYKPSETRYDSMIYRRCGNSGLQLPAVSLGLWHNFGDNGDYSNMKQMLHTAFDSGICHFDLANNYGPEVGAAERNFGRLLKEEFAGYRDEILISTKAGYQMWPGPYGNWGSRKYLLASLDQSLERMGIDYVDIFYHHRMDPETPLEETMSALAQAVTSGKALYIGISRYDVPTLTKAAAILDDLKVPYVISQDRLNMFDRSIVTEGRTELIKTLQRGLIIFSPLAQGLLSDHYLNGIPENSRMRTDGRYLNESSLSDKKLAAIRSLNELAQARGQSLAQMALAWVLHYEPVTSVLIGASKPSQILDNVKALENLSFTDQELKQIDDLTADI